MSGNNIYNVFSDSVGDELSLHKLWAAVIDQAFIDIECANLNKMRKQFFLDAADWLLQDSDDFRDVCHYASQDTSKIRNKAIHIMMQSHFGRMCLQKRYGIDISSINFSEFDLDIGICNLFRRNKSDTKNLEF